MQRREFPSRSVEYQACGDVYWVTGLPGAGKKTLARALTARLAASGRTVVSLDGGRVREILGGRFGYGLSDRRIVSQIYARLCRETAAQGTDVVFATVSMFEDVRRWNRANIDNYCEIYLRASIEVLTRRHPRGLYAAGLAGRVRNVPGLDLPIEEPEAPDVLLDDDGLKAPFAIAAELFQRLGPNGLGWIAAGPAGLPTALRPTSGEGEPGAPA